MLRRLEQTVRLWARSLGLASGRYPTARELRAGFEGGEDPLRPTAGELAIASWERRHGYSLPRGLRAWMVLSDGFHRTVSLVHPISAIGPMVPFAHVPELLIQPESWFELGNPDRETVCVDLAYRWPGGDYPIFTSGDDTLGTPPRIIAPSFEAWFVRLLREAGREYWCDPDFESLGDPWVEHRRRTPVPELPARLRTLAEVVAARLVPGADEAAIASSLGVTRLDVEQIARSLQHRTPALAPPH